MAAKTMASAKSMYRKTPSDLANILLTLVPMTADVTCVRARVQVRVGATLVPMTAEVTCAVTYTHMETHSGGGTARRLRATMPKQHAMAQEKSIALQMMAGSSMMISTGTRSAWSLGPIEGSVRMAHAMQ
eukprot:scaffold69088_cov60-Phaeocystis_antarctica.AAC.2